MAKKTIKVKPLSRQHRRFVAAYRRLRHATEAYLEVYARANRNTADSEGPRLLGDPRIAQEVDRLDNEALKREHMSADEALALTARIARISPKDFYWQPGQLDREGRTTIPGHRKPLHELTDEQARCVAGFKSTQHGTDMLFRDQDASLDKVLRHHKLLTDKLDVSLTTPLDKLIESSYNQEPKP